MGWDSTWEKVFQEQEWGKYPGESLIQFIARNYYKKDRKRVNILEIGCGPGANIWYIAREGFNAYGIDGSETAIERAKNRLQGEGLSADLRVGDITSLPYDDNFFDAVVDVEAVYSNPRNNSKKIINEVRRVLKKEGLFYSRTFADDMFIGNRRDELAPREYTKISDGPLAGMGFVRLTNRQDIQDIYGVFNIQAIDKLEYTMKNGTIKISEWVISCVKL